MPAQKFITYFSLLFFFFMGCVIIFIAWRRKIPKKQPHAGLVERYGTAENQQIDKNGDALPDYEAVVHGRDGGELVPRKHWGQMDERILDREMEREEERERRNISGDLELGLRNKYQGCTTSPPPAASSTRPQSSELREPDGFVTGIDDPTTRSLHLQSTPSDTLDDIPPPNAELPTSVSNECQCWNSGYRHISVPERSSTGPSRSIPSDPILLNHHGSVNMGLDSSRSGEGPIDIGPRETVPPPKYTRL